jgi:hypothetical protein
MTLLGIYFSGDLIYTRNTIEAIEMMPDQVRNDAEPICCFVEGVRTTEGEPVRLAGVELFVVGVVAALEGEPAVPFAEGEPPLLVTDGDSFVPEGEGESSMGEVVVVLGSGAFGEGASEGTPAGGATEDGAVTTEGTSEVETGVSDGERTIVGDTSNVGAVEGVVVGVGGTTGGGLGHVGLGNGNGVGVGVGVGVGIGVGMGVGVGGGNGLTVLKHDTDPGKEVVCAGHGKHVVEPFAVLKLPAPHCRH